MSSKDETYTYRGGKKLLLKKSENEYVVRASPEQLKAAGITNTKRLSPHSTIVTTSEDVLNLELEGAKQIATSDHAYYEADTGKEFLTTDRVLVTFKDALSSLKVDEFAGRYGLLQKEKYTDRDYLFQLVNQGNTTAVELVVQLSEQEPLVEIVENDLNYRATTYQTYFPPTDPNYPQQWHLHQHSQNPEFDPRSSTRCEEAWQILNHFGDNNVVVAVTDDGCKLDHPDFDSATKFADWGYFRGNRLVHSQDVDAQPSEMYVSGANHGTSCAGVIAGEVDAVLTVGAAPNCRLLPIQWESDGPYLLISDSKLLTALNYISDKVDIMSNSWGSSPSSLHARVVLNKINQLSESGGRRGQGIVFLWAAGNENCPIQHSASVDVPYSNGWGANGWAGVNTSREFRHNLADLPGVMHIAALASNAQRSHYSNYGTGISLCAPSSNSHTYWRMSVEGLGITTTTGSDNEVTPSFGGTSSATPLVAGIAALVISADPSLPATEVISVLKRTAGKDLNLETYPQTPSAVYDTDTSWDVSPIAPFDQGDFVDSGLSDGSWSPWFGHGRVDAVLAVSEVLNVSETVDDLTFSQASSPNLDIPDHSSSGIIDAVQFSESATLASIKVKVDISHTYIGDLRLILTTPFGSSVVLHDREGASTEDLNKTFDGSNTPALNQLRGESIEGTWALAVQDLASIDTGQLKSWEVEIAGQINNEVFLEESPGVSIPDNEPSGIERALTNKTNGIIDDMEVALDITHTYIGDLIVELIAPSGATIPLHNRAGGSSDNLIHTYTLANQPDLTKLIGTEAGGTWRLHVFDQAARDVGKLNHWSIKISLSL